MPLYQFTSDDGREIEEFWPMKDRPALGATRVVDGVVYTRRPTTPGGVVKNYEHVAHSLQQWVPKHPGEKSPYPHVVEAAPGRFKAAFKSKREIQEYEARQGGKFRYGQS